MKGFFINLDGSTGRLQTFEQRLNSLGFVRISDQPIRWQRESVVIERISAVDGRKMSAEELAAWQGSVSAFWDWTTHKLTPGEIGCFLSHRAFWRAMLKEQLSHAFVIEDDIQFSEDIFALWSSESWIPSNADFVKLNLFPTNKEHTYPVGQAVSQIVGRDVCRTMGRIYGTGCYIISNAMAKECLQRSEKMVLPVDLFLFDARFEFAPTKTIYTVMPGVAVDDELTPSTIGVGVRNRDKVSLIQHLEKGFFSVARRWRLRRFMKKYGLSWIKSEFRD